MADELCLTSDIVSHIQRIADRSGDKLLKETATKAQHALASGLHQAPGVHLTRITPHKASELVQIAVMTQDLEIADFARYCQSVADSSGIGIEPTPGKIDEEIAKGQKELAQRGRVHTGPGYGPAFSGSQRALQQEQIPQQQQPQQLPQQQQQPQQQQPRAPLPQQAGGQPTLQLTMDVVAHIQRIADRTGNQTLKETAHRAHSACVRGLNDAPGVHLTRISPTQASSLVQLAVQTQDRELADFARYCQSVAQSSQIGIEPTPGKILQEIEKGMQELKLQGRSHSGPGYGAAFGKTNALPPKQSQNGSPEQQQGTGALQPGLDQWAPPCEPQHSGQQKDAAPSEGVLPPGLDQRPALQCDQSQSHTQGKYSDPSTSRAQGEGREAAGSVLQPGLDQSSEQSADSLKSKAPSRPAELNKGEGAGLQPGLDQSDDNNPAWKKPLESCVPDPEFPSRQAETPKQSM